jgi:ABC-type Fe3+ transport system substrate-binding protein
VVAIKNAPHPNAVKVYINWMLSQEAQTIVVKHSLMDPVRNDISEPSFVTFKGPKVVLSLEDLELSEKHRRENYLANKLGLKR